jgi:hypothetical protein
MRVVLLAKNTGKFHLRKRSQVLWCVERFSLTRFFRFETIAVKSAVTLDRCRHPITDAVSVMQLQIQSVIRTRNLRSFEILFDGSLRVKGRAIEVQCGRSRPFDAWGSRGVSPYERAETAAR